VKAGVERDTLARRKVRFAVCSIGLCMCSVTNSTLLNWFSPAGMSHKSQDGLCEVIAGVPNNE